eukprot:scaffold48927_cov32-Phaeocystis_antarctica.AAC.3
MISHPLVRYLVITPRPHGLPPPGALPSYHPWGLMVSTLRSPSRSSNPNPTSKLYPSPSPNSNPNTNPNQVAVEILFRLGPLPLADWFFHFGAMVDHRTLTLLA